MNFCEECGSKLQAGVKFCENCGKAISHSDELKEVPAQQSFQEAPVQQSYIQATIQQGYQPPPVQQGYQHFHPGETAPKKKSKVWLFVIAGIVLFVFLVAGSIAGYFIFFNDSKTEVVKNSDDRKDSDSKETSAPPTKTEEKKQTETKKEGFQRREKKDGDCGDYPELSERKISADELIGVSAKEKRFMKADILMRHGYIFTDEEMLVHFVLYKCYDPKHMNVNAYLTEIEKYNIKLLK